MMNVGMRFGYNGDTAEVVWVGHPQDMKLGTEVHEMYMEYILNCDGDEDCTRLHEIEWTAFDVLGEGVHCLPTEELKDMMD